MYVLISPLWVWPWRVNKPIRLIRKLKTRSSAQSSIWVTWKGPLCRGPCVSMRWSVMVMERRKGPQVSRYHLPSFSEFPCGKRLLWGSRETEPRIQMGEVSTSAPQQGLSKQRAVDWAEKNCILCSSAPDVSNKCQQKILRKDKANICSRHRTPTRQWSESREHLMGPDTLPFSLYGHRSPQLALSPHSTYHHSRLSSV